jgi:hypothetical protein
LNAPSVCKSASTLGTLAGYIANFTPAIDYFTRDIDGSTRDIEDLTHHIDDSARNIEDLTRDMDDMTCKTGCLKREIEDITRDIDLLTPTIDDNRPVVRNKPVRAPARTGISDIRRLGKLMKA